MASSYAPPINDISNNPYSGTPPSDEFGNPMDYDYQVPGNNSYDENSVVPGQMGGGDGGANSGPRP